VAGAAVRYFVAPNFADNQIRTVSSETGQLVELFAAIANTAI